MRDAIARALTWARLILTPRPRPGRHSPAYLTAQPTPDGLAPVSPWSRPWTSISKEEAAEIFRLQIENDQLALNAWELRIQWERRRAAALATMGIDHPYTYPDAPFDAASFRTHT
ncbi:hypothetical protein [Streptomyces acidiscabies]|uniref:Uncharacterized protein n=2 Tax=Streptomyces acidiscabies TaxID=42234 RepID=A0AAP6BIE4_9ACTN|nr:hypothetical protein [Streptomyces acidiscabies]MBZ3910228.1 hypothetical protein [Streptomyces acidiscabies]MDX2965170.1 hypothetical protein [Streptomyces acidiscabies]MDX3023600.1 hypothetical protein [Streptomyces acidiscabies]MDX3789678.1 hypothetical protein [Streptomyces acidiscabies]GAV43937.1 hypothetical protein Saa2_06896 [Streptomyces acidiscabies]